MTKRGGADLWQQGFWADESVLSQCDVLFAPGFCQQLRQYQQYATNQPPVGEAGRPDPRANLLLAAAAESPAAQALSRLVIGQARLSWRLADAWTWLTPALHDAGGWAGSRAYLALQGDLEAFRDLPLFDRPRSWPLTRAGLLQEARVIRYLRTGRA